MEIVNERTVPPTPAPTPRSAWLRIVCAAIAALGLAVPQLLPVTAAPAAAVSNDEYAYATVAMTSSDINRPQTFFVYATAGETITVTVGEDVPGAESWLRYLGAAFYTITAPDGSLVETNETAGGYPNATPPREEGAAATIPESQPEVITVPEGGDGIYRVAVRGPSNRWQFTRFPWSITVNDAAGTEQTGRTWVNTYHKVENWPRFSSQAQLAGLDYDYWFVSQLGYEYELNLMGYVGWNSVVEASLLGNTSSECTSLYHSLLDVSQINISCGDRYRTFFEKPDPSMPAEATVAAANARIGTPQVDTTTVWVKPVIYEPEITQQSFVSDANPRFPKAGTYEYALQHFAGNYRIEIDADGDGSFAGERDLAIAHSVALQADPSVPLQREFEFDGVDALGDTIDASVATQLRVSILHFPEIHFVLSDVEQLAGGIRLIRQNGGGDPAEDLVFWNDALPPAEPGGEPQLLGTDACGPADRIPSASNPVNPIVNLEGMHNVGETPALHYWDTRLATSTQTNQCRDTDNAVTGTYGNEKLLDTWTHADRSIQSSAFIVGPALHIEKTVTPQVAIATTPLSYTVTATNVGSEDFTLTDGRLAVVADDLGGPEIIELLDTDSLRAEVAGAEVDPPTIADGELRWAGELLIGESVTLHYELRVPAEASEVTSVTNRAVGLLDDADPFPDTETCELTEQHPSNNCVTLTTPFAQGPMINGSHHTIEQADTTRFDVIGELVTLGDAEIDTVQFIDSDTGVPSSSNTVADSRGVWQLDPETGQVTFTASANAPLGTSSIEIVVTDKNGFTVTTTLTVTVAETALPPVTPGPDPTPGPTPTPTPGAPGPEGALTVSGFPSTTPLILGIAGVLMVLGIIGLSRLRPSAAGAHGADRGDSSAHPTDPPRTGE